MRIRSKNNKKSGLTLIEALVAIIIIMVGLIGPLAIAIKGVIGIRATREEVIASFLAEDAIEYIIAHKRQLVLDADPQWLHGLALCETPNGCAIDTTRSDINEAINSCGAGCDPLEFNNTGSLAGSYGYSVGGEGGWNDTIFTRTVYIDEIESDQEAAVTIEVSWGSGTNSRNIVILTNIFNSLL